MKKFNFKAFFVDHGEKIGFGVGLLLVLFVLTGSDWFPYAKAPEEIIVKAEQAKRTIDGNTWPDDVRKGFSIRDYGQNIRELRGPLATTAYDYSTPLWHPLYRPQQLAKDPEFLAVIDLDAKAGEFVMAVAPKLEVDPTKTPTGEELATTAPVTTGDDEFAPSRPAAGNPFAGPGLGMAGPNSGAPGSAPMGFNGFADEDEENRFRRGGGPGMGMAGPGMGMAGPGMGMMGLEGESAIGGFGGSALAPGVTGRGERFVAVRGVWPVWQQLQKYRTALNLQSPNDARALLEITDFVLERKTATAGSDPWAGEWQEIDISRAKEILTECPDFDIDTFDPRLVDVTITMPLPKRITGKWGDFATHEQIKQFKLSDADMAKELKLQDRLMREYEKMKERLPQKPKPRGGFAGTQANFRGMADSIFASADGTRAFNTSMNNFIENDPSSMGMGPGMGMGMTGSGPGGKLTPPDIKARLQAAERLFLFRYFDFDVRPGYAYRYRVKLKLRNPNYQRKQDEVIDKSVAEGEFRETDWSTDSTVAVVPETTHYFLKNVFLDPVQEAARSASKTIANLKIYQWDRSVGTMIADTIQVKSIGQFLGEKRKTWQLDVAKPSFLEKDVTFETEDLYLDGLGDLRMTFDDHKDLKISSERKGMLGLNATAVVMTEAGELKAISPGNNPDEEKQAQNRVDRERAHFESIKGKEAAAANPLDGGAYPGSSGMLEGETPGMFSGAPGGKKGRGASRPNPRKAGASFGSSASEGMMRGR